MYRLSRLAALGCVASLAMVGCSANGGVSPTLGSTTQQQAQHTVPSGPDWIYSGGTLYHKPHVMLTRNAVHGQAKPNLLLQYYGGPVLVNPKTYLILWGYKKYGDADKVAKLLKSYLKKMGGSGHNNIYTQYYETVSSNNVYITNPKKQFGGAWDDETNAVPNNPTDAQVAQEALNGVAHFGAYDPNGSYVVATPHGHSSSGFGTQWCAYHSVAYSGGNQVSYTNLPYMPDAGGSCGANFTSPPSDESGTDEGVTIVEGHEYGESVTDPIPGAGWYNFSGGEIGDICAWQDIENDPFGKKSYTSQPMFSNATASCVQSYP
ncbi:MAG: hypothetical protein WA814_01940 [Candidatus Baltobacteraceae bacterium]